MKTTKQLITTALFAALIFAATFVIKIPIPVSGGYVHPGDSFVMMAGMLLGPVCGTLAAAVGSLLSDVIGGYVIYAPATAVIKGLIALCCYFALHAFERKNSSSHISYKNGDSSYVTKYKTNRILAITVCGIIDILFVVGGYFIYESLMFGVSAAIVSVIPNTMQGAFALVLTFILYPRLNQISTLLRKS